MRGMRFLSHPNIYKDRDGKTKCTCQCPSVCEEVADFPPFLIVLHQIEQLRKISIWTNRDHPLRTLCSSAQGAYKLPSYFLTLHTWTVRNVLMEINSKQGLIHRSVHVRTIQPLARGGFSNGLRLSRRLEKINDSIPDQDC